MRRQTTIIFILISLTSFCQDKFKGTYCSSGDFVGHCITFKSDSLFEYEWWSCTYEKKGVGTYTQDNEKLKLKFATIDTLKNSFGAKEFDCNSGDSVVINLLFIDRKENESAPFVEVWLKSYSDSTKAIADIDGKASFKIKKSAIEYEIVAFFSGFKPFVNKKIKTDKCLEYIVYLVWDDSSKIENGTVSEFKILKVGHQKITVLEDNNGNLLSKRVK